MTGYGVDEYLSIFMELINDYFYGKCTALSVFFVVHILKNQYICSTVDHSRLVDDLTAVGSC